MEDGISNFEKKIGHAYSNWEMHDCIPSVKTIEIAKKIGFISPKYELEILRLLAILANYST